MQDSRRKLVPEGVTEAFVQVAEHRIRYLTGGSGPPLLLLHGLMGFSFSWSENLTALAQHFTVFAPDMLNTGYSDRADAPADLQSLVTQVLELMDALQLKQADVIGSSYGGTTAMALAAIAPHRVNRLVLVSPAHVGSESGRWQATVFSTRIGALAARGFRFVPAWFHGYFIKRMYGVPARALPGTLRGYAAPIRIRGTARHLVKVMHAWKANFKILRELMPRLRQIPALVIWGSRDPVVPLSTSEALLEELPNARLAVIESAGHLPYEELPEQFNKLVLEFLLADGHEAPDSRPL